jgi:glycosyltransferase involved in cell wall biosynthesis
MLQHSLVSVIVPVYNGEHYLKDAIASIRGQCPPSLEIVVIDDGSTDGTAHLIDHLGDDICRARQAQRGPAAARNHGLALSQGEFVAFLDADDLWPPDSLRMRVDRLLAEPALDVVLGRVQPIHATGARGYELSGGSLIATQLGSALFRRDVFARVGTFDERLSFSEDHDWFLRAREQGIRLAVLDRVTLQYRLHASNMTRCRDHRGYQLPAILKASLDRRRAGGAGHAPTLPPLPAYDHACGARDGEQGELQ